MSESYIAHSKGGTLLVGPDAMLYAKAAAIWSGLPLYKVGIQVTRGMTGRKMLDLATGITKKPYKRGEYDKARADLRIWLDAMKMALPTTVDGVPV